MTPESAQPTLPFLKRPVVRAALVPLLSVVILLGGFVLWLMTRPQLAHDVMFIGLLVSAIPLLKQTVLQATRGNFATDAVAAMAIVTAIVLDQPVPGLVIVLMQSGGEALEAIAQRRATHALNELEDSAPRVAHRQENNAFVDVLVRDLREGDVILVKPGDVTPADAIVVDGRSHVDTSRITGEPLPISASKGTVLLSGCVALNGAMQMRVLKVAAESQYERIVEMVRTALARKAPIQRIADRYAVWFTPITAVIATLAYVISDNPMRALAVLVVATPCPLILATPVAIIGGINRAAKVGFLFRTGLAIERLASVRAMIFDKTGTLTTGQPQVSSFAILDGAAKPYLLSAVGALELGSSHILAREVVRYARAQGVEFELADEIYEVPGHGVRGRVDGRAIEIGSESFIADTLAIASSTMPQAGAGELRSYVAVDRKLAGYFAFADRVRSDLPKMFADLRDLGVEHTAILSGDDEETVRAVAGTLQIDEVHAELKPIDKVGHVERIKKRYGVTAMIGDGVNDAPALAASDIGIAVAARGGGIAAETADVVLLGQDLARIADGVGIARRTLRIAHQSIGVGLGLSAVAMIIASAGYISPIAGAVYQEVLDVLVILNALRAAAAPRSLW